jgi:hypothetical protein
MISLVAEYRLEEQCDPNGRGYGQTGEVSFFSDGKLVGNVQERRGEFLMGGTKRLLLGVVDPNFQHVTFAKIAPISGRFEHIPLEVWYLSREDPTQSLEGQWHGVYNLGTHVSPITYPEFGRQLHENGIGPKYFVSLDPGEMREKLAFPKLAKDRGLQIECEIYSRTGELTFLPKS